MPRRVATVRPFRALISCWLPLPLRLTAPAGIMRCFARTGVRDTQRRYLSMPSLAPRIVGITVCITLGSSLDAGALLGLEHQQRSVRVSDTVCVYYPMEARVRLSLMLESAWNRGTLMHLSARRQHLGDHPSSSQRIIYHCTHMRAHQRRISPSDLRYF